MPTGFPRISHLFCCQLSTLGQPINTNAVECAAIEAKLFSFRQFIGIDVHESSVQCSVTTGIATELS